MGMTCSGEVQLKFCTNLRCIVVLLMIFIQSCIYISKTLSVKDVLDPTP